MINRYSSRRQRLDKSFLADRLDNAKAYDRIAGYFSSSILEVAGESLESMSGPVRVVCNSELNTKDVDTARAANNAMRQEWCAAKPENLPNSKDRFSRLYEFLKSGKMQVRVLPKDEFGLIHGKAGVITLNNGIKTSFIGSANETYNAWRLNYELVWEDDSEEAINWVQEEFDSLWNHPKAVKLADFVVEDIHRLSKRTVVPCVEDWRENPDAASAIIESPVYRLQYGLWEHQKYFVKLAFEAHRGPHGAHFVLADMVGLGKTLQLAMIAQLIALYGEKPILVIAPKTLLWQWQDEMKDMLDMPSAVWNGKQWVDENEIVYPPNGPEGIKKCPRRVGIVSQGLITSRSEVAEYLKQLSYECVIVDEAHRARRKNLGSNRENETPDPNNLLAFLYEIGERTKSMILATATPVQIYPIEAWDLVNILARNNESVLGNTYSRWRHAREALDLIMGLSQVPTDDIECWSWIRNPLPPASENLDLNILRHSLKIKDEVAVVQGDAWDRMSEPDKARVRHLSRTFFKDHNPFIRHIIRRTREFLENTIDPETNEPYLKPVKVRLYGEGETEAIALPPYLREAYRLAEDFCQVFGQRAKGTGFLKTLLLRRMGSTIYAGMKTAETMLGSWENDLEIDDEDELLDNQSMKNLTIGERTILSAFIDALKTNQEHDPKYNVVLDYLRNQGWLKEGCIIFSQYFDSIDWLSQQLSKELRDEKIGIYAGGNKSGILLNGVLTSISRDNIKKMVKNDELRLILGTDAASEGINLQRLGTLINLDLPWNPTRLEQRKGRIQRIGQVRETVLVFNMRYRDSVEDRVHELLSDRLENIFQMFGQVPDVLEDVWVDVALGEFDRAKETIDAIPIQHPFEIRYNKIEQVSWEDCSVVLDSGNRYKHLTIGW